jgi:hypothetical protein
MSSSKTISAPPVTASSILNKLSAKPATTEEVSAPWDDVQTSAPVAAEKPKMQSPDDIIAAIRRRQQQK